VIWTALAASQLALDPNGEPGTAGARSRDRQHSQPRACCWPFPWHNGAWWTTAHHQHRWQRRRRFRCGDGLPWRVLGYVGGGARLGSRAQQCSAYGHTRAAPLVEAKTVLNWAFRVWERVEAASSAASVRLALAGVTRAAKSTSEAWLWQDAARPRRLYFAFRRRLQHACGRLAELPSLWPTAGHGVASAGISERPWRALHGPRGSSR